MSEKRNPSWLFWLIFAGSVGAAFVLGLLISTYAERRVETQMVYKPQVKVAELEPRSEIWGKNHPKQYESYLSTEESSFKSRYNGSAEIDMLEVDPRLVVLWAGYPFAADYKQGRGHRNAIIDIYDTLRTGAPDGTGNDPMPTTCWTCKSPDVPRVMKQEGIAAFYTGRWSRLGPEIVNPIGCADCHDPESMNLVITRPALIEAFRRRGKDISTATHQELRSLVCAQCHVEYYFDKRENGSEYLTHPWDRGLSAEEMEAYYDERQFSDWTHAISRAPMLKGQHPDYEIYTSGVHAARGVACADCHMPYTVAGNQKYSDHHVRSPLDNVANSCQACHREETEQLIADVYERQERIIQNRDALEKLLVRAHVEAGVAWEKGATEKEMAGILTLIRHAQWRWDYVAASHGASFHSPLETSRVIAGAIEKVQECRVKLARVLTRLGVDQEIPYPDIATKTRAQQFIGLDMEKRTREKAAFKQKILPQWLAEAEKRQKQWGKEIL